MIKKAKSLATLFFINFPFSEILGDVKTQNVDFSITIIPPKVNNNKRGVFFDKIIKISLKIDLPFIPVYATIL